MPNPSIRPEYPRPHFDRSHSWRSLNGEWDFHADPERSATPDRLGAAVPITVPFAWETEASGVEQHWLERGWYRREVDVPAEWARQRIVLHFGAVHHRAEVWVGGRRVGAHEGGYTPFELDITDALDGPRANVVVCVDAPNDKREIVHGKQRSVPRDDYDDCAFTPSSGIWQPVWLEARPATHVVAVDLRPGADLDAIEARIEADGPALAGARIAVRLDGEEVAEVEAASTVSVVLPVAEPRLWSPDDPHRYAVEVTLTSADGVDRVGAGTGLRSIRTDGDRILLNGERVYLRGVLDQGYWPGTGITAPDDAAFVRDLDLARAAGFTLVRKHLKLEDPRFLHHADRLGMLVWAEPASTGRWSEASAARFEAQLEPMVRRDGNHPSIVVWGLYNEEWGLDWDVPGDPAKQAAVGRAYDRLTALDPSRPAVDNSGWSHVRTDLVDWHVYDETPAGWSAKVAELVGGGAETFPVGLGAAGVVRKRLMATDPAGALGRPNLNSEFGGGKTSVERGWNLRWQTAELRRWNALAGYVWTELYDIEHEMAGIWSFDRRPKDDGGNPPGQTNADTVIVPELTPVAPGRDLVAPSGEMSFDVRVSHHGAQPVLGDLLASWGAPLGVAADAALRDGWSVGGVKADPFRLSDPLRVAARLPDGVAAARLHLALVAHDVVVARTAVDVVR